MQSSQPGEKGLNISCSSSGKIKEQDREEGALVEPGTVINLKLEQTVILWKKILRRAKSHACGGQTCLVLY